MRITRKKTAATFSLAFIGLFLLILMANTSMAATTWVKLIDFGMEGYSETSNNWKTYNSPHSVNNSYRYLSREVGDGSRTGTATWKTTIPYCGLYEVRVSCRKTENRTPDADYYVTNSDGNLDHYVINQINHHNILDWDPLGFHTYQKDQVVMVHLDGEDDGWSDCADATQWKLIKRELCEGQAVPAPANSLLLNKIIMIK